MRAAFLIVAALSIHGCAYFSYIPNEATASRLHPLGMTIYNKSGRGIAESDWEFWFNAVNDAHKMFKECVGNIPESADYALRRVPIIILPPDEIKIPALFHEGGISGFTDLERVFVRLDFFNSQALINEWKHIYLYVTGKRIFGDPSHKDKLFRKCAG